MSTWELDGPDTVDHYRTMIEHHLRGDGQKVHIKIDLHDTGHRAIEVGCYVEETSAGGEVIMTRIGDLEGRFGENEGQFGCQEARYLNCACMQTGVKWENMPHDTEGVSEALCHDS